MSCVEIIAVCSQIHTKHLNAMCGQNVELLNVEPGGTVHIVTAVFSRANTMRRVFSPFMKQAINVRKP